MFYIIDCLQDGLQSFFWILSVKEEAIEAFHPCAKKRDRKHLLFGNITGQILTSGVSDNDVKEASVISDIKNRSFRYILLSDHGKFDTGKLNDHLKCPLNQPQTGIIHSFFADFADQPFNSKNRNTDDQK